MIPILQWQQNAKKLENQAMAVLDEVKFLGGSVDGVRCS